MDRFIILDNSVVELGESFNLQTYLTVEKELKPDIVIAPDNFIEPEQNLSLLDNFLSEYQGESMVMGVPHGETLQQYLQNFEEFSQRVPALGISIHKFAERFEVISTLQKENLIDNQKYYHLLGCKLPQEFLKYSFKKEHSFLKSLDTSSPVIHGYFGIRYTDEGLERKSKFNIDYIFQRDINGQMYDISYNIKKFRDFIK